MQTVVMEEPMQTTVMEEKPLYVPAQFQVDHSGQMQILTEKEPWRTEAEITPRRQKYLAKILLTLEPDVKQGHYPFKGIKLSRADVEWLLSMHENGRGPVDWHDEDQRKRKGLDLRGANLSGVDLHNLPLTRMQGGLVWHERYDLAKALTPKGYKRAAELARVNLENADLRMTHLEGAELSRAELKEAILRGAHLEGADLVEADLQKADFRAAHLEGANLNKANLEEAALIQADLEGADLRDASFRGADLREANLRKAFLQSVDLSEVNLSRAKLHEAYRYHLDLCVKVSCKQAGRDVRHAKLIYMI